MAKASRKYRRNRKHDKPEFLLNTLPKLQAAFPLYYGWYMANRGQSLPFGWIMRNMSQLDADFLDSRVAGPTAQQWLNHFKTRQDKAKWYKERFASIRDCLGDGIMRPLANSNGIGQANSANTERRTDRRALKLEEDEDYAIEFAIRQAESSQRTKDEMYEEREEYLALCVASSDEEIFQRYPDLKDLAHHILHEKTEFDTQDIFGCASALPFGAKTAYEAIRRGLLKKYFHFNLCTTTVPLTDGEWHKYLTNSARNGIFSSVRELHKLHLSMDVLFHSGRHDLKFIPLFSYIGNYVTNGGDRMLLKLEDLCQGEFHQKAPVGTLGFRFDKAGATVNFEGSRVCTLMLVWSERSLLEGVEAGELVVNPTKEGLPHMRELFNMDVWDPDTWAPVQLPPDSPISLPVLDEEEAGGEEEDTKPSPSEKAVLDATAMRKREADSDSEDEAEEPPKKSKKKKQTSMLDFLKKK